MSRLIRYVRLFSTKGLKKTNVLKVDRKNVELDKEAYQAYLQSVCDPTGEYHSDPFMSPTNKNMSEAITLNSDVDEQLNDYLSEMADAHSKSKNRS